MSIVRILRLMLAAMKSYFRPAMRLAIAQHRSDPLRQSVRRRVFAAVGPAHSSISTASTVAAPRLAATMASTPVPQPMSSPRFPVSERSQSADATRQVVAWCPEPESHAGMTTTSSSYPGCDALERRPDQDASIDIDRRVKFLFPQGVPVLGLDGDITPVGDAVAGQQVVGLLHAVRQPLAGMEAFSTSPSVWKLS